MALIPAAMGAVMSLYAAPAGAGLVATTASFFTAPADGTLTFTFEGFSAADTDHMAFTFNGDALFTNQTTAVETVVHEAVVAGQVYELSLHNDKNRATWSSNPASNSDGLAHLAGTSIFSDFHLGVVAPTPVNTNCAIAGSCYFGWEDLPRRDEDFNDLVFALQFTASDLGGPVPVPLSVPEPAALSLFCAGLLGLGFTVRRRR
jgi:hypothetical protein